MDETALPYIQIEKNGMVPLVEAKTVANLLHGRSKKVVAVADFRKIVTFRENEAAGQRIHVKEASRLKKERLEGIGIVLGIAIVDET